MKPVKCPNCGSENVVLKTDLKDFTFYLDDDGYLEFEERDVRDELYHCLEFETVKCHCYQCRNNWNYVYEE